MDKEIRQYNIEFHACNEEGKKRTVEGRAIPFNTFSPNREGFREMITPEAVEGVIENSDIKFLYNHDGSKGFLARNNKGKGSLKIEVKEDGVYFSFPVKKDNLSSYVLERIDAGELSEMSFAFVVADEEWNKQADGVYERIIKRFDRLFDFSVVDSSYYGLENQVACRSFEEFKEKEAEELRAAQKAEEERLEAEKRAAEEAAEAERIEKLAAYYKQLKEDNTKYLN